MFPAVLLGLQRFGKRHAAGTQSELGAGELDAGVRRKRMGRAIQPFARRQRFDEACSSGAVFTFAKLDEAAQLYGPSEPAWRAGRSRGPIDSDRFIDIGSRQREVPRIEVGPRTVRERPRNVRMIRSDRAPDDQRAV